jgi:hypothetical protein
MATARGSFSIGRSPVTRGPRFVLSCVRASREVRRCVVRGSREARPSPTAHPNKPMHPTADTSDFIFGICSGRRVIGGVRRFE